ncbi:unnamed protein product [Brassica rapa]|uniref:Uncharacterized protein n=1 Tax=Brassica campestris TaxID=3711 RepID=A0A3P6CDR6_BRACM|nr:unnamed protein product [Brassica rapa]VDD11164.1 unnamed protein product [Brassica rapa]
MLKYDFSSGLLRLWIQCDENTFLRCCLLQGAPQHRRNCTGMHL